MQRNVHVPLQNFCFEFGLEKCLLVCAYFNKKFFFLCFHINESHFLVKVLIIIQYFLPVFQN